MTRDEYIQAYIDHYAKVGVMGAGGGLYDNKKQMWYEIGFFDDMSILDYGCGWGTMLQALANHDLYHGVDIVPQAIEMARERWPGVSFELLELGTLNIPPVDFAAAQSVFTHARKEDAPDMLSDIYRSLKPGGLALIDVLHEPGPDMPLLRFYHPREWLEMLEAAGFTGTFLKSLIAPTVTHSYYKVVKP